MEIPVMGIQLTTVMVVIKISIVLKDQKQKLKEMDEKHEQSKRKMNSIKHINVIKIISLSDKTEKIRL